VHSFEDEDSLQAAPLLLISACCNRQDARMVVGTKAHSPKARLKA
jgi:hypothetical protein